ncbi:MAG TPA: BON domain-containing protein [Burkholderiales bacterium]|jgi:hyperosmotically inducible protein|nr:BON domain-containing protein [Burkholderiales bacterium]
MNTKRSVTLAILAAALLAGGVACAPTSTRQGAGEYVDDAAVTARVKTALIQEPDVKAGAINVETYRGVVSLSGFVDSQEMANKAVTAAQKVGGVRSVKNDMRVKPAS